MIDYNWKKLQNGSDIRGVAIQGVKDEPINIFPKTAEILGKAFCQWLKNKGFRNVTIAVGTDSRLSGNELKNFFSKGINLQSGDVIDCGMASTPAMFMTTLSAKIKVQGAVMITASHLPFNRNGFKFFIRKGGLDKKDIGEILELAEKENFPTSISEGKIKKFDFLSEYAKNLSNLIRKEINDEKNFKEPLKGTKILVDAGNGAGGFFAYNVLKPLGADINGSLYLNPDGNFPNHAPNPEDEEAVKDLSKAVVKNNADLGIIFDPDVDRAAIVDKTGKAINRNRLIALIGSIILEEHPQSTIVTDSITSEGLNVFIEKELKGKHHRFKRGYKNVINEAIRINNTKEEAWLAIETSGHAALKENYFLDDGAFLVAKIIIKMAQLKAENKTITQLIEKLPEPAENKEFRLKINTTDFIEYGNNVINTLKQNAENIQGWKIEEPNYEGIRVKCTNDNQQGWFLVRLSLHDPVLPINIESNIKNGIDIIKTNLKELLSNFEYLDLTIF